MPKPPSATRGRPTSCTRSQRGRSRRTRIAHIEWLRSLVRDMEPFKTGGVYLNFSPEGDERLIDGFGAAKYARLVALKKEYDPSNIFCFNHNIRPGGTPSPSSRA